MPHDQAHGLSVGRPLLWLDFVCNSTMHHLRQAQSVPGSMVCLKPSAQMVAAVEEVQLHTFLKAMERLCNVNATG